MTKIIPIDSSGALPPRNIGNASSSTTPARRTCFHPNARYAAFASRIRTEHDTYIVQPNDTLGKIANRYSVPLSSIIENNLIENPDYVEIGQTLHIPPPELKPVGPDFKIIPDSELVNGPYSTVVDLDAWLQDNQYHFAYSEEIFDRTFTGIEITHRIARDYSINPRLLLAILEYRSGWVTELRDQDNLSNYPIVEDPYVTAYTNSLPGWPII